MIKLENEIELIGHRKQWKFLKRAFVQSNLAHAYLFSGDRGLGKKDVALKFIKLINCQNKRSEEGPCDSCLSCRMIEERTHPDFCFVGPENGKNEVKISQIKDLIHKLSFRASCSLFKTAIIDQAHLMNKQAQNCFLKTLEEPKGKTVLVLISERPDFLLETIRSRVQEIRFFPLPEKEIRNFLKKEEISNKKIEKILKLSLGRPRRIFELLHQPKEMEKEKKIEKDLVRILDSDLNARFNYIESLTKGPINGILESWLRYLRRKLLEEIGTEKENRTRKVIGKLENVISVNLATNINKKIILRNLMLEI